MIYRGKTLSNFLEEDSNSFNLVRLVAALCVVLTHAYVLLGLGEFQPLKDSTPYTIGRHAVNLFFVLSGLMLTRSLDRNPQLVRFMWSRMLRIFPALFAFGAIFAMFLGPFLTYWDLADYFVDAHTYQYPFSILVFFNNATPPHGIFLDLPRPGQVNGSLWTIRYEVAAYLALAAGYAVGVLRTRLGTSLLLSAAGLAIAFVELIWIGAQDSPIESLSRYSFSFLLGVNFYRWRSVIPTAWWTILPTAIVTYAINKTGFEAPAFILLCGQLGIILGTRDFGMLSKWTRKTDISYGTYIYGWPVQQIMVPLCRNMAPLTFALVSMLIVMPLGYLSWRFVERPALQLKSIDLRDLISRLSPLCRSRRMESN
ncbi:MAG: acyltransferase family protein [Pseudomonadota bacterium]